jgi:hypothetical protein
MNINYDYLNEYLKTLNKSIDFQKFYRTIPSTTKLARLIVSSSQEFANPSDFPIEGKISYNDSIKIATDFFKSIDPSLEASFQSILRNDASSVHFIVDASSQQESSINESGEIKIYLTGTTKDIFTIVHLFSHKFFHEKTLNDPDSLNFTSEVPSFTMENLLKDYLVEQNINPQDAYNYISQRISSTYHLAQQFLFESVVLSVYSKNLFISKDLIKTEIAEETNANLKEYYEANGESELNRLNYDGLSMPIIERDIIAILASSYLKKDFSLQKLIILGQSIYGTDPVNSLEKCDLNYFMRVTKKICHIFKTTQITENTDKILELCAIYLNECSNVLKASKEFNSNTKRAI